MITYRAGGFRFGGRLLGIFLVGVGPAEGAELVPVVAAGEDAAEAEDEEEQQGGAQREAERRPGCVHVRRRKAGALHDR